MLITLAPERNCANQITKFNTNYPDNKISYKFHIKQTKTESESETKQSSLNPTQKLE